jgi:hypothetical protein
MACWERCDAFRGSHSKGVGAYELIVELPVLKRVREQEARGGALDEAGRSETDRNDREPGVDPSDQRERNPRADHRHHHERQEQPGREKPFRGPRSISTRISPRAWAVTNSLCFIA